MDSNLRNNLTQTFLELIKIDEIYQEEKDIISYVTTFLTKYDVPYKIDSFGNIIGYLPGKGQPVLLNTHLDIPENVPNLEYIIKGNRITSTGKSILGADPKSGLAVLLEFIRYIKEQQIETCPIEFVFTRGEEAGLQGAIHLDFSLLKAKTGLVLDEDGPCTQVVVKAPGYLRIDATISGKTVHTRDWREGKNVTPSLGEILSKVKQGEIIKGVTCNIGLVQAGTARNSVAGSASLGIELRSFDMAKLEKAGKKVTTIIKKSVQKHIVEVAIDQATEFASYSLQKSNPLFKRLEKTYTQLRKTPHYYATFGGSDAAIFNAHGITAVPIGSAYYLAHQYSEYINLDEMETLIHFLHTFTKIDTT